MKRLVIREAHSDANDTLGIGIAGVRYGEKKASLTKRGEEQASILGKKLVAYGADYDLSLPVATSTAKYCTETASVAGLKYNPSELLDNPLAGKDRVRDISISVNQRRFPSTVVEHLMRLFENPPEESIWIVSGYEDAGICALLGLYNNVRFGPDRNECGVAMTVVADSTLNFMPGYCEIREVDFPE